MKRHNLINERLAKNWTQQYVASQAGISKQAYSNIENGNRDPSYPVVCKLEDIFGKPHRYLMHKGECIHMENILN